MEKTAENTAEETKPRRSILRRVIRAFAYLMMACTALAMTGWAALAVCFADLHGDTSPRSVRAALLAIVLLATIVFIRPYRYGLVSFLLMFFLVLGWFFSIKPSNARNWPPEVALVASAEVHGDELIVHNVRNFDYRSTTDFVPAWEERKFDLNKLTGVDCYLCYWGSKSIAHAIVSFSFDDGRYLPISIEARREKTESYSAIQAFFRQFELIYVFSDERDVIRLRSNYRHEDVYLYHTRITPAEARAILLSYVESANALHDRAEFYNALTSNCVTSIVPHGRAARPTAHLTWRTILSGYAAQQAYRNGNLDDSISFEELQARSRINDAAVAADQVPSFSARIRVGLPQPAS